MKVKVAYSCLLVAFAILFSFGQCGKTGRPANGPSADPQSRLSDDALLDTVQQRTFRYFWDFGHPVSGLARERSNIDANYGHEVVTTGGTGFGIMAMVVAAERNWVSRDDVVERLNKMVEFLGKADRFHGAFPHWLNGETGKVRPFSENDNGADIVETSLLFEGLLTAREYFSRDSPGEKRLSAGIDSLWRAVEWDWFTQGGQKVLYWHWSPDKGWKMNHPIHGWNECLITYVMAAASPTHGVDRDVYAQGFASSADFLNGRNYYGLRLPLGPDYGGPLFFAHYSFLGLDPHGLKDQYADYWEQNKNHASINYQYCVKNPKHFKGYGEDCWGLTASDNPDGYNAHSPTNDLGVISPTAALSSFPYTPEYSMKALRHFYYDLGASIWREYGFVDAFDQSRSWVANSFLAIDQGPIIVMIENYRTGLLWKTFMKNSDVQQGLKKLGFESPYLK